MAIVSKRRNFGEQTEEQMTARKRMALFPSKNVEVSGAQRCYLKEKREVYFILL